MQQDGRRRLVAARLDPQLDLRPRHRVEAVFEPVALGLSAQTTFGRTHGRSAAREEDARQAGREHEDEWMMGFHRSQSFIRG